VCARNRRSGRGVLLTTNEFLTSKGSLLRRIHLLIAATTAVAFLSQVAGTAYADGIGADPDTSSTSEVMGDLAAALDQEGVPAVTEEVSSAVADVELPTAAGEPAEFDSPAGELTMDVPASGADLAPDAESGADTALFEGDAADTTVAVQDTGAGLRALVHIDSPDAPERFDFEIGGDVTRLEPTTDGGVAALDAAGDVVATAPAPWATDANGVAVPTHYEINGTTLTQVVEHHAGNYSYGIVADPWWNPGKAWKITKCVLAITWVVGTTVFVAAKITKVKAAIKGLGGIKEAAKLLVGATSRTEKLQALGSAGASAASYFLGIDTIQDDC